MVDPHHPMLMRNDGTYSIGSCDSETMAIYLNDRINKKLLKHLLQNL